MKINIKKKGLIRITSGSLKNKIIHVSKSNGIRPTSEKVRQAIFNCLTHSFPEYNFNIQNAKVADLYAGTGALGLEALSRGASHISFFENDETHLETIKKNIKLLNLSSNVKIYPNDPLSVISTLKPFDLILVDPPYGKGLIQRSINAIANFNLIKKSGIIVIESNIDESLIPPNGMQLLKSKKYGKTLIRFTANI